MLIYAETKRDWLTAALACYYHNLTIVICYTTLGADATTFSVNQTNATVVIADPKFMPVLMCGGWRDL